MFSAPRGLDTQAPSLHYLCDDQATIQLLYKGSDAFESVVRRISNIISTMDSTIIAERIARLNLDENLFDAIEIEKVDLSSMQELIGKLGGGFLP